MPKLFCILIALHLLSPQSNAAQNATPDATPDDSELRWAADATSGAPYVYVDPNNTNEKIGFEKDVMAAIARKLNRKLVFVQNTWEGLIPGLERGDYDVAANGIEITPEREKEVLFSIPYYATFEQIVVRQDNKDINELRDLNQRPVGTLKASLAHYILEKQTTAKIRFYEDESNGYQDLERGRTDAFFMDYPVALYYALPNPALKAVGPPIGEMTYAIAISKKYPSLRDDINRALAEIKASGELEEILDHWKLLHPFTVKYLGLTKTSDGVSTELKKLQGARINGVAIQERLTRYWELSPLLAKGAGLTLGISVCSMILAMVLGLLLVCVRMYGPAWLSGVAVAWIEIIRGTPLLIQLFLIFYGLPYLGIKLTPFWAAVIGLGLNYATTEAENYRAGIQAIPRSQIEAADALALSPVQKFFYVILPQAYRIILPPVTNDFIALLKDSSLVSVITMVELTTIYTQLASTYYDHLGLGLLIAAIYFLLGYPFVRLARTFEKALEKKS
jgi:polar amino acid transport system substrate-binding protein